MSITLKSHALSEVDQISYTQEVEQDDIFSNKKSKRWFIIRKITYIILMNAALPIALYYVLKSHLSSVWALVLSSTPTIVSVIAQAIFIRKIDSIGLAVIFGFILSVVLAAINEDPKMLLMRESFVTAAIGIICTFTLLPIRYKTFVLKPVLFYIVKDLLPLEPVQLEGHQKPSQDRMDFYWQHSSFCRLHFRALTAINTIILEIEFGLKLYYILNFDIDTVVILSNSTLSVIGILCFLLTIAYIIQVKKRLKRDEPQMLKEASMETL